MAEEEQTLEEIIQDFIDDLSAKFTNWWETGVDSIPKASELIERLRNSKFIK